MAVSSCEWTEKLRSPRWVMMAAHLGSGNTTGLSLSLGSFLGSQSGSPRLWCGPPLDLHSSLRHVFASGKEKAIA